jgi:hypothetical protein
MGPTVSRLLFWGMVCLVGCGTSTDDMNTGIDSANGGSGPAAGSGGSKPPAAGVGSGSTSSGSGGSTAAAGTSAGSAGSPANPSSGGAGNPAANGGSSGGETSAGGAGGSAADAGESAAGGGGSSAPVATEKFSFFVTSLEAMQRLSKSEDGFGGDLRYGEATGLAGADKICSEIAESSMPGAAGKGWRAFLSAKAGGANGAAVHAKDRIGEGPWYDRTGRVIAMNLSSLLETRPGGADPAIADNLPNEHGEPNRASEDIDNHDTITGSNEAGEYSGGATCEDWTTTTTPAAAEGGEGGRGGGRPGGGGPGNSRGPMCGHSWPANSGQSWIRAHNAPGCAPSVSLVQMGGGSGDGIGNGGGYGGIYCFALAP